MLTPFGPSTFNIDFKQFEELKGVRGNSSFFFSELIGMTPFYLTVIESFLCFNIWEEGGI
jgi:hypothetical protein